MRRLLMAGAIVFCGSANASAQQVCQTEALKDPNPTLGEMYAKAETSAKACSRTSWSQISRTLRAKLYATAKEHGAEYIPKGYELHVELAVAAKDRHTSWNIMYVLKDDTALMLQVDANTGVFEQVVE